MFTAYEPFGPESTDPFPATRWSLVAQAKHEAPEERGRAWNELFGKYWMPLYAYVRSRGYSETDAEELTQGFFAMVLHRGPLSDISESRGKLRAYLLTAMKHFLIGEHRKQTALKRGGGEGPLSLDIDEAETRWQHAEGTAASPDVEFDRQWALQLLEETLLDLEAEYAAKGNQGLFQELKPHISFTSAAQAHADIAKKLGMKAGAVRIAVYRLRQRFAAIIREKILETVTTQEAADEEVAHLLTVFSKA